MSRKQNNYAQAYYFGTIGTQEVATQISQESVLTQADVIGVIERLAYFCKFVFMGNGFPC